MSQSFNGFANSTIHFLISDKIIIVSQWTECLALIGNTLKQHGLTYCEIKGGSKNRNEIVEVQENVVSKKINI